MAHTVEKIGGTSIANTSAVFENILIGDRCGEDLYNRIFVVSAYSGMTDLLLEHKKRTSQAYLDCSPMRKTSGPGAMP